MILDIIAIISVIAIGTFNGFLFAEAMYGRWPWDVVNEGIEWMGRKLRRESLVEQKQRELEAAFLRRSAGL